MATSNTYMIMHIVDGDNHDYNVLQVPTDILLGLANNLRKEYQDRSARAAARSFKEERAIQHQRHLEKCAVDGSTPVQQFLDFPL